MNTYKSDIAYYLVEKKFMAKMSIASSICALGALLLALVNYLIGNKDVYTFLCVMVALFYFIFFVLERINQIYLAKLFFSIIVPYWIVITMLTIGGYFSQSVTATAILGITLVIFENQKILRRILVGHIFLLFIIPTVYLTYNEPYYGVNEFAFDEIICFIFGSSWMILVLMLNEKRKNSLIDLLKYKNNELKDLAAELKRFNNMASHDLKTPVNNIINLIELAKEDLKNNNTANSIENLNYAKDSSLRMLNLVDDILELTAISENKDIDKILLDLNDVVKNVIADNKTYFDAKNAKIKVDELPAFFGNNAEIKILFQNIMTNAVKYNRQKSPELYINSNYDKNLLLINFVDNGIGIPSEYQTKVFDFFTRLHSNVEFEGTGIGLGICKKIADKYEGEILVESKLNKGSTFTVILPHRKK